MKLIFSIYIYALGLYACFSLPALLNPGLYIISLFFALVTSLASLLVFAVLFAVLAVSRLRLPVVYSLLFIAVPVAVLGPLALFFRVSIEFLFDFHDYISFFPLAAIMAGWASLAINHRKIRDYFVTPAGQGIEALFNNR